MSTDAHVVHAAHGAAAHDEGHAHGTRRSYLIGFLLSVVLTAIPFWLVMGDVLGSQQATAIVIMGFAVVQIVVHMIYFLHMTFSRTAPQAEGGWSMLALIFTLILVIITLSGSLWVMYHLNANMMPPHDMSGMR